MTIKNFLVKRAYPKIRHGHWEVWVKSPRIFIENAPTRELARSKAYNFEAIWRASRAALAEKLTREMAG